MKWSNGLNIKRVYQARKAVNRPSFKNIMINRNFTGTGKVSSLNTGPSGRRISLCMGSCFWTGSEGSAVSGTAEKPERICADKSLPDKGALWC